MSIIGGFSKEAKEAKLYTSSFPLTGRIQEAILGGDIVHILSSGRSRKQFWEVKFRNL